MEKIKGRREKCRGQGEPEMEELPRAGSSGTYEERGFFLFNVRSMIIGRLVYSRVDDVTIRRNEKI